MTCDTLTSDVILKQRVIHINFDECLIYIIVFYLCGSFQYQESLCARACTACILSNTVCCHGSKQHVGVIIKQVCHCISFRLSLL